MSQKNLLILWYVQPQRTNNHQSLGTKSELTEPNEQTKSKATSLNQPNLRTLVTPKFESTKFDNQIWTNQRKFENVELSSNCTKAPELSPNHTNPPSNLSRVLNFLLYPVMCKKLLSNTHVAS